MREAERVCSAKDHRSQVDGSHRRYGSATSGYRSSAYAQRDPLNEYKMAGYDMFNEMMASIREDTVKMMFRVKVEKPEEREQVAKVTGTNKDDSGVKAPVRRNAPKIQPNDPCPCGSGKKYKQCCGRFAE